MKNSIEFWHDVCMEVVRKDFTIGSDGSPPPQDQGGPTRTSRALAIAHLAMHDAYFGTTNPSDTYLQRKGVGLPPPPASISLDSAIGTAAAVCLLSVYPSHQAYINRMSAIFLDGNSDPVARDNGHRYGNAIAHAMMNLRANDGSDAAMGYRPSTAYGRHREDPYSAGQGFLSPHWGSVTRFCTSAHVPLDAPPGYNMPDYLTDPDYSADYEEVKSFGVLASSTRTAEQHMIGYYWGYDGANEIGVPPRLYNQIARAWLDKWHSGDVEQAVKLLAMVNAGMADAAIDAWHWKYQYNLWRPVIGIREANHATGPQADGASNATVTDAAALGDPFWKPLGLPQTNQPELGGSGATPPFPAYPSGHATFGATLFQIMQRFSGKPALTLANVLDADTPGAAVAGQTFDFVSDEQNGKSIDADSSVRTRHVRTFRNFARPTWENAISRVFIGVHWRFDGMPRAVVPNKEYGGVPLGLTIGKETFDFFN